MSVFTISDLHLSTLSSTNKSMEVFGRRWQDYTHRLEVNWTRLVDEKDTVIVPGDISWALTLDEALSDLKFIDSLPGRKILGKGNHDFWWGTMKKNKEFLEKNNIKTIDFLFNNSFLLENFIIAGTRGWYHDEEVASIPDNTDFDKLVKRESQRLLTSLKEAEKIKEIYPDNEILVFLHFPPYWNGKESEDTIKILKEYNIKRVFFGHIHGNYSLPRDFIYKDIKMSLVSADFLEFIPKFISDR